MKKSIEKAKKLIEKSERIVVLSGAGLSTAAGIPDFRSKGGLYSKNFKGYNPEEILSYWFLYDQPDLFYEYIRENFSYKNIRPTKVYEYIASLEKKGKLIAIATQNIDGLHQAAGSKNVYEVHGNLVDFYCPNCNRRYDGKAMLKNHKIWCECGGLIRPDVVLFGEAIKEMGPVFKYLNEADLLLVLGSSLKVFPIAYLPQEFIRLKKPVIIINKEYLGFEGENVVEINDAIEDVFYEIFDDYK